MKIRTDEKQEGLRSEYDFATMKGRVRGKYAKRYAEGSNLVLLAPDVAAVFHDTTAVNEALRSLIGIARARVPRARPGSKRALQPTS